MYVPSLISIPFVLSKIRLGQATVMKNKWLREITLSIYRVGLWFLCTALPLIAIYLYTCTKFDLNGNSSFKVICRMARRTKWQLYASPFGEHNNNISQLYCRPGLVSWPENSS